MSETLEREKSITEDLLRRNKIKIHPVFLNVDKIGSDAESTYEAALPEYST